MAKITFGKFQGWDTLDLAKAGEDGRNYLRWGAESLKSPFWRKEFEQALKVDIQSDIELMAQVTIIRNPDIGYDEALYFAQAEIEQNAETDAMLADVEAKQEAVIQKWLPRMVGKTTENLRGIGKRFEFAGELDQIPLSRFSSVQAKQEFLDFMKDWEGCYQ